MEISNSDNIIDSRDVIKRIEELEDLLVNDVTCERCGKAITHDGMDWVDFDGDEPNNGCPGNDEDATDPTGTSHVPDNDDSDDWAELEALRKLADDAGGSPDWTYGETLIADHYFEDYARELAEDIGAIDRNAEWPARCIDWEQAARELQSDYYPVRYGDETYWIRG